MICSVRQSNFELLRIISMLMVLLCHANGYVNQEDMVGAEGVIRVVINQLFLICVNVFVMISGWFGIKSSWKGAAALLFQVAFLGTICNLICAIAGIPVSFKYNVLPDFLGGYGYWFIVAYLILYALSPALNKFCESASEKELRSVVVAFFGVEFFYGFLLDVGHFDYGFSALFFIGLYLLARYVRLYPNRLFTMDKHIDFGIYLFLSILSMFGLWFGYKWFGMGFHLNHYDSPLAILASLFFLLFFSKLEIQSRFINWLAASVFAIYLIHEHSLISQYYSRLFKWLHGEVPLYAYYPLMFCLLILIGICCILLDKPRIYVWNSILKISGKKASL